MIVFFLLLLCSLVFAANTNAAVTIEGNTKSYDVAVGDTLPLAAKNFIKMGDNFVKWEIVSGTGKFTDETGDSTEFIPSSSNVVLRAITRTLPAHKVTEAGITLQVHENAVIGRFGRYGILAHISVTEPSNYAIYVDFNASHGYHECTSSELNTCDSPTSITCSFDKCDIPMRATGDKYIFIWTTDVTSYITQDSITLRLIKASTLSTSVSGSGTATIDSSSKKVTIHRKVYDYNKFTITATPSADNNFDHWEVASGTCSIEDSTMELTSVYGIKTDCQVKAVFTAGKIYEITNTPTKYTFEEHLYAKTVSHGQVGVRFTFTAPSSGTYSIVLSNTLEQDTLSYFRYTSSDYSTEALSRKTYGTGSESISLTAGQTVYIVVKSNGMAAKDFYISYATQTYRLTLNSDGKGTVSPDGGYPTAYAGAKNSINATGLAGYRFSNWQIISGSPVIENSAFPYTYAVINSDAEIKATFKPVSIKTLSLAKQEFNFLKDYFHEKSRSTIRFTWTPTDTFTYCIRIEPLDEIDAYFSDYGNDSLFNQTINLGVVKKSIDFYFQGEPGKPHYWTIMATQDAFPDTRFNVWISIPYSLEVQATKGGSTNPSGKTYYLTGETSQLTAWPHGGYKFDSWEVVKGNVDLSSKTEANIVASPRDSICVVKAKFKEDSSAIPMLDILQLDIGDHPQICAQVSVTDKNTGLSFYGLDPSDLILTQDGNQVNTQVTSIELVMGISVVIVVDESSSMQTNDRAKKAKEAIRSFINDMGPYDRAAIVGFVGNKDSTVVRQAMTSNKAQLLSAVNAITTNGSSTNIISGAYAGLQQIANESNATAVILFSDGANNDGTIKQEDVISLAKAKKTSIYTIGLETDTKHPLEDLAKETGGIFTFAKDASELGGIYTAIRGNVASQYMVCYETPDKTLNGETHNVVISMEFNKKTAKDSVQWNEAALPPTITLTEDTWKLIDKTQAANTPLTISVYISSMLDIASAQLYLRGSSSTNAQFSSKTMTHVSDSLWEFTVPANLVTTPSLEFYVIATDTAGQIGKSPRIPTPGKEPYTIFIDNDIPVVEEISVACEDSTTDIKTFSFRLTDNNGINGATLHYRDSRTTIYQERALTYSSKNDAWATGISANVTEISSIDYYLRVTDSLGSTVRYLSSGFSTTNACEIKVVIPPEDSSVTDSILSDTIPEDTVELTWRDSIVYSLIADTAEIYDKDLDGRADFVRVHFKEERDDNITSIDSIFWNSNHGEWRFVPQGNIQNNRNDGKWVEAYINSPYKYGLTKADTIRKPFLGFTTIHSDKMEYVMLTDKVGAVPSKATKLPGKVGLKEYMNPEAAIPSDTLIIRMSEPIKNVGEEKAWEQLFRYSESCKDTVSQPIILKEAPTIRENGQVWTLILDGYSLKAGSCLFTDPSASYIDLAGNAPGRGGIEIEGKNRTLYLSNVSPLQPISGIGNTPMWIPPEGDSWEPLPDTLSAISVRTMMPYTAEVYIFDAIATYVTHFKQKFGYENEMEAPARGDSNNPFKLGFLHWNQRSDKGRLAGTGIYIWKIFFKFEDGHKETRIIKTGIYRKGNKK
ncbi:MAG: VWA domain-containing protein [Fibrobacter sp.]|uniref:InlB B-repeat-containing protein n=1 Tax=Fibrobacter sp. TaxID=35828 RepID=UPI001B2ED758|nr:VWA domain-containing protein [Fibrobacter sp.]MBO7062108.1 VWA domain-containing protein [Fibrobacter sp.]